MATFVPEKQWWAWTSEKQSRMRWALQNPTKGYNYLRSIYAWNTAKHGSRNAVTRGSLAHRCSCLSLIQVPTSPVDAGVLAGPDFAKWVLPASLPVKRSSFDWLGGVGVGGNTISEAGEWPCPWLQSEVAVMSGTNICLPKAAWTHGRTGKRLKSAIVLTEPEPMHRHRDQNGPVGSND